MAYRLARLAFPAQRTAFDVPEQSRLLLLDAYALIGMPIEQFGKRFGADAKFGGKRQKPERHLGDSQHGAVLAQAIGKAGPPHAQGGAASTLRAVGLLQRFLEPADRLKRKSLVGARGRITVRVRAERRQLEHRLRPFSSQHLLHRQQDDAPHLLRVKIFGHHEILGWDSSRKFLSFSLNSPRSSSIMKWPDRGKRSMRV